MRDRLLTPFFPLHLVGAEVSSDDRVGDRPVSARRLEGAVVGNGRFLLVKKTLHTEDSAVFTAKDMVGGIDVELEVHRCDERGIRLGRPDTQEQKILPNLLSMSIAEAAPAPRKVQPTRGAGLRNAWQRVRGLFRR